MNSSTQVNRIFDYFAVCGYDSDRGPITNDYLGTIPWLSYTYISKKKNDKFYFYIDLDKQNVVKSPLEGSYTPQVLAHYPEKVSSSGFDSSAVTTVIS